MAIKGLVDTVNGESVDPDTRYLQTLAQDTAPQLSGTLDCNGERVEIDDYLYASASPTISGGTLVLPIDGKTREVSWDANITSIDTTGSLAYSDTTVVLTMDGSLRTVTWPAGWLWLGAPPDAAANEVLILKLETINSTVYASAALAESL